MRAWATLLGGLAIWAVHFFALYALGEFAPDSTATRVAIGVVTIACMASDLALLRFIRTQRDDPFERWQRQVGTLGIGLSVIAILWQGLVPLF